MAKRARKKTAQKAPAPSTGISHRTLYAVVIAIAILCVVAIIVAVSNRAERGTAWATQKSAELHVFMQQCHDEGGTLDAQQTPGNSIAILCQYPARTTSYVLELEK